MLGARILAGIPWARLTLNTVSTDNAFVNGHVTFAAPRDGGQISRVLMGDDNRVHKGDLRAELDWEPYQIAVSHKESSRRHCDRGPTGGYGYGARY